MYVPPKGTIGEDTSDGEKVKANGDALNENPSLPIFLMLCKFISMSPPNVVSDVDGLYNIDDPPAEPLLLKMIC